MWGAPAFTAKWPVHPQTFAKADVTLTPSINAFTESWLVEAFTKRIRAFVLLPPEPHPAENIVTAATKGESRKKQDSFETRGMLSPKRIGIQNSDRCARPTAALPSRRKRCVKGCKDLSQTKGGPTNGAFLPRI